MMKYPYQQTENVNYVGYMCMYCAGIMDITRQINFSAEMTKLFATIIEGGPAGNVYITLIL